MTSAAAKEPEWLVLQKRIFLRWVNQKLACRNMKMTDIVKGWTGENLQVLVEVLSEGKPFKGKIKKAPKSRFEQIDNANNALAYANEAGVHMEIKTSAENLVDGSPETAILGYVWCIMRTFMRFGDDSKMNCRDALLSWVKNQTAGYKNVDVKDFGKSFHSGLALCALVHHFRPNLVNFDSLSPDEKHWEANLKTAFAAANKYFGLDEYLTPAEFRKLDEKAMIVYVSEYYAGVAAQRKLDTYGRRITKLVRAQEANDALKAEYLEKSERLKKNLAEAARVMDVKIDNTMAGAQKHLDDFYDFQTKKKSEIVKDYLAVEGIYNQLSMKLADMKRKPFVPPQGCTLAELREHFQPLEKREKEVNTQLQNEVIRQKELISQNKQHQVKFDKLEQWAKDELKYLETKEKVESHGAADYQLNCLKEHGTATEAARNGPLAEMLAIGKKLASEKYEDIKKVEERENKMKDMFQAIDTQHKKKEDVLQDDLHREILREKVEMWDEQHTVAFKMLKAWIEEKEAQLSKKEAVDSVRDARVALDALELYKKARSDLDSALASFKQLGQQILHAEHKTEFSEYKYPKPAEINEREQFVTGKLEQLQDLYGKKEKVLLDDLAREEFREKVVLNNQQHIGEYNNLVAWINEKKAYLSREEKIASVREARVHLNMLDVYSKSYAEMTETTVSAFYALGQKILTAKYSGLSEYVFPEPDEVKKREAFVQENWKLLSELYDQKKAKIDDDLAREMYIEKIVLLNKQHIADFNALKAYIDEKEAYLSKKEAVECVRDAATHINNLSQFRNNFDEMTEGPLAAFKKLGKEVLDAKYDGITKYSFPTPAEVKEREQTVDDKWNELNRLHASKLAVLTDDKAREEFRERLTLTNKQHEEQFNAIKTWIEEKETYLKKKEEITSVREANGALNALDIYAKGKADMTSGAVAAFHKLTAEILAAEYKTELSQYRWPQPGEVKERDAFVQTHWKDMDTLHATKLAVLRDDLARESFREKVELNVKQHVDNFGVLTSWIDEKAAYLKTKESVTCVRDARTHLAALSVYAKAKAEMTEGAVTAFHKLTQTILSAEYKTDLSSYKYPTPQEITDRDETLSKRWANLDELHAAKLAVLEDDLAREEFRERLTLRDNQHQHDHGLLKTWIEEKEAYLRKKEEIHSSREAKDALNLLDVYLKKKADMTAGAADAFHKLTAELLAAEYKTQYSTASHPAPGEVKERDSFVLEKWTLLDKLYAEKKKVLEDDLAREEFREKLQLKNQEHINSFNTLKGWITEKEAYLQKKETVESVRDARAHLGALDVYHRAFQEDTEHDVPALKKLGRHIVEAKYSGLTTYVFPHPEEIKERESFVDEHWQTLDKLYHAKLDILTDDLKREEFAERVVQQNSQHTSDYDALKAWITEKEAYLQKKEAIASVREAHVQLGALDVYNKTKEQMTKSNVAAFKKLGVAILTAKYTGISTYVFPTPNEVKEREAFVDEKWEALDKLYATKLDVLKDDLAREEYKEKTMLLNEQHIRSFTVLKNWIAEKKAYLQREEKIRSIQDARVQLNLLDVFVKDKKDMTDVNVAAFKKVGQGVLTAKYERLSTWVFETPQEVKAREEEVDKSWVELDQLAETKQKALQAALEREQQKEKLRLKFAGLAGELLRHVRAQIEKLSVDKFGYSLKEVEAAGTAIADDDKKIAADIEAKRAEYQKVLGELKEADVTENPYTQITDADFEKAFAEVVAAQKARQDNYAKALEKEKHNDALCKTFADAVVPFLQGLNTLKEEIMASRETLEQQITTLETRVKTADQKEGAPLKSIQAAYDAVVAAGIQSNPYTLSTFKDVDVQWHQYIDFLNRKLAALNEEIQSKKNRGMTKGQIEEINKQFAQYDLNKNGQLEPAEFKACLYSLGYDLDMVQVKKIMKKFGGREDYIDKNGFFAYMVAELGDSGELEDSKAAFKFIGHNKDAVSEKDLLEVIPAHEVGWIAKHAPKKGADIDYNGFVNYLFNS